MYFHLFDAIIAWLTECTEVTIGRVTVHIILCKFCFYQKEFEEEIGTCKKMNTYCIDSVISFLGVSHVSWKLTLT